MPTYPTTGPLALKANIAEYLNTKAMRAGQVKSDLVTIDFCAFHYTTTFGGKSVPFGVHPDLTDGLCPGGCGAGA